jgi:sigma-E factor negative regulatory protein RseC
MPYKNGIIVNVEGNGWAEVVTDKLDACADCVSARNCPSSCKSARMVTRVRNDIAAQVGDTVSVYISAGSLLKSAAILYLVPVVFLLIGAVTGSTLAPRLDLGNSTVALLLGLAGLCFGYFLVKAFSVRLSMGSSFFPKIDRILYRGPDAASATMDSAGSNAEGPITGWQETAGNQPPSPQHFD